MNSQLETRIIRDGRKIVISTQIEGDLAQYEAYHNARVEIARLPTLRRVQAREIVNARYRNQSDADIVTQTQWMTEAVTEVTAKRT